MKILVIDYLSYVGHKRFNKIHFDAISKQGHELSYIGRKGYFDDLLEANVILTIPDYFYKTRRFQQFSFRLQMVLCLRWIYKRVRLPDYDLILFPTYEVLSFYFSPFKGRQLVINHQNVSQLSNKIKRWFTIHLDPCIVHITLDKMATEKLKSILPKGKVFYVPHGYDEPSRCIIRPQWLSDDSFFLCPVNRNYDKNILQDLFLLNELADFLNSNNVSIVSRDIDGSQHMNKIIHMPQNTPQDEYDYLIQHARAVILPYTDSFQYRCSGIFFECIATDIPVIVPRIESFTQYSEYNVLYYSDVDELFKQIKNCMSYKPKSNLNKKHLLPYDYWERVLKCVKNI